MEAILNFFGGAAKVFTWFITAVIIPIVAWASFIKADIITLKTDVIAQSARIERNYDEYLHDQKDTNALLREIKYAIGRLDGKLEKNR